MPFTRSDTKKCSKGFPLEIPRISGKFVSHFQYRLRHEILTQRQVRMMRAFNAIYIPGKSPLVLYCLFTAGKFRSKETIGSYFIAPRVLENMTSISSAISLAVRFLIASR